MYFKEYFLKADGCRRSVSNILLIRCTLKDLRNATVPRIAYNTQPASGSFSFMSTTNERCIADLRVYLCIISCEGPHKTVFTRTTGSLISRLWIRRPIDDQLQYTLRIPDYRYTGSTRIGRRKELGSSGRQWMWITATICRPHFISALPQSMVSGGDHVRGLSLAHSGGWTLTVRPGRWITV